MMVNGTLRTRTTWSIGSLLSIGPNSFSAVVWPMIATLPAPEISAASKARPAIRFQSRATR